MPPDLSPLWISLKTALIATAVTFFLGIAAAYWMLNYRGRGKSLIEGIFVSPLILPPTVVGFLLLLLFGKFGPIGQRFDVSIVFTWYAAVMTATVVAFPLMYRTALGAFEQIDANLLRVARTLGASEWIIFWRILLPLAIPGVLAGTTLSFARALGEFGATLMLAGNIPGQTQTIPMAIYFAVESGAMNEAWFWTLVILSISLSAITAINFWQEFKGRQKRGIKAREQEVTQANQRATQATWTKEFLPPIDSTVSESGLFVDIQKQLSDFELKVSFHANEVALGLLGPSGAGKSMLLQCITGVETPTKGRIVLNGRVLFDSERGINLPSRDRRIGFLVQNYALFPHLTIAQNIAFGLPRRSYTTTAVKQQIETQLAAVHLEGLGHRYPHQLSGGQQQRVALARALASQPEALLLDEPFSALDTYLRSQLEQEMIARLANYQGVTLFVTHNLEEAYRICPKLLVLNEGRAISLGAKQDIFERPETFSVAQLTGCKNFSRAVVTGSQQVEAIDWGCALQIFGLIPERLEWVGIRAHQLTFLEEAGIQSLNSSLRKPNTFPCWLASTSETPHRMTLFLKLNSLPCDAQDYHVQAEIFKEKWSVLKERPFPWHIHLDPMRLILMKN